MDLQDRNELISLLHSLDLRQDDILHCLALAGNIISKRHLKRILSNLGLFHRKHYTNTDDVILFIQQQMQESGMLHGYRWMFQKCKENGLHVRKEHVRLIQQALDPEGSIFRY